MRKAGLAERFVPGTDMIIDADRHHRGLAIGMDQHAQAVGQSELAEANFGFFDQRLERCR